MHRKDAGFTLIEVVVTLAVAAILAVVAVPSLAQFIERQRASAAMTSLTTHMALARTAAITHQRPAMLCPTTNAVACDVGSDWGNGWMLFIDHNKDRRLDGADDLLRVDLEPRSRHMRLPGTQGRPYLRYLPDGRSAGSNLTINICNRDGERLGAVIVNNGGRPRVERDRSPKPCPN